MHYITLDLEWNQAYAQKALAVQRQLSSRLRGEVIQIGAVKLDKSVVDRHDDKRQKVVDCRADGWTSEGGQSAFGGERPDGGFLVPSFSRKSGIVDEG